MNRGWYGERPTKRARLRSALARWSCTSSCHMITTMSGAGTKQPSGAQKRQFSKAMAPALSCFEAIVAPAVEGEPIKFYCANMVRLLQYIAQECASFYLWLTKLQDKTLDVVLSHDETTGGNVLQTDARQKVTIVYCNFCALEALHTSPRAWVPLAAIAHWQVNRIDGGMAKVHALLLEHWAEQGLDNGVDIANMSLRIVLRAFVADMDAHRQALGAKGSAGLKPCAYCRNCVAKDSKAAGTGKFFDISEPNFDNFEEYTQQGLQAYLQQAMARLPHMTNKDAEMTARCLGYRVEDKGVWFSPVCAAFLPLEKYVNDSMHVYFANGIACLELNLLATAVQQHTGKTTKDLLHAVLAAGWQRNGMAQRNGERQYWIKRLFTSSFFTGAMYKGSAKQTLALLSLFRWLAESVWASHPMLHEKAACFAKLCQVVDVVRHIAVTKNYTQMTVLQQQHLEASNRAWGALLTRPKHHHALHLGKQYARTNTTPSCWGTESKHRDYKQVFARILQHRLTEIDGGACFSRSLMPRLLLRTIELLNENPISDKGFQLKREFTPDEVSRVTDLQHCKMSTECAVKMLSLKEDDFILHGHNACRAGRVQFVLEKDKQL